MARDAPTSLAPGFRFHPTDEELVRFYLKRKVTGKSFRFDTIAVVDVYKSEPWDLPHKSKLKTRDLEWYFFSVLDKKYGNGSRTNRATEKGYWKTTGKDRPVKHGDRTVGMKKTLVYHFGRAPHGARTNWVMHEYKLVDEQLAQAGVLQDAYVLCRIFEKSGAGPKNGEKYGAPLIEEEWDDDDDEVAHVPTAADEALNQVSPGDTGAFLETDDLDKKLDLGVGIGSAALPSNFYHGECSSYPVHSPEVIEDQKPLEGIYEPQNGQLFNINEQYAGDINSVKDGEGGEPSNYENTFSFNYLNADDVDVFLDATDYPPIGDDGGFLEAKDLMNPYEGIPIEADASGAAMVNEYLSYSDDDICKYISFDSPLTLEGENFIPDQESLFNQQNLERETNISVASKHDCEAPSSNEASSKQNPELKSGNTHPLVKHANKLLASLPAPPAFASEFPPKDVALRLQSAAQSSNSAPLTAGMVRITDITITGNVMDWMVAKNGGLNAIISTGFSHPGGNSAALMSVSGSLSGKTSFLLSYVCVFLMCFSVLILSLSFKACNFVYTGK